MGVECSTCRAIDQDKYEVDFPLLKKDLNDLFGNWSNEKVQWKIKPVDEDYLRMAYCLIAGCPTDFNCSPLKCIVVSNSADRHLLAAASNFDYNDVISAPVSIILCYDTKFYRDMPVLNTEMQLEDLLREDEEENLFLMTRNAHLQAGFFIMALKSLGLDVQFHDTVDLSAVDEVFCFNKFSQIDISQTPYRHQVEPKRSHLIEKVKHDSSVEEVQGQTSSEESSFEKNYVVHSITSPPRLQNTIHKSNTISERNVTIITPKRKKKDKSSRVAQWKSFLVISCGWPFDRTALKLAVNQQKKSYLKRNFESNETILLSKEVKTGCKKDSSAHFQIL